MCVMHVKEDAWMKVVGYKSSMEKEWDFWFLLTQTAIENYRSDVWIFSFILEL